MIRQVVFDASVGTGLTPPPSGDTILGPGPNAPASLTTIWSPYDGLARTAWSSPTPHPGTSGETNANNKASLFTRSDSTNPSGTGSQLVQRFLGGSSGTLWPASFPASDYGGTGPTRWTLASNFTAQVSCRTLYLRFEVNLENMSSRGYGSGSTGAEVTTILSNLTTAGGAGSSATRINFAGSYFTAAAHVGQWLKPPGNSPPLPIIENGTNYIAIDPNVGQFNYNYPFGELFSIQTYGVASGLSGWNAGVKWFFPRIGANSFSTGSAHGSVWTSPTRWVDGGFLNHFVNLHWNFGSTPATEGFRLTGNLQTNSQWDGTTVDANGVPQFAAGTFASVPNTSARDSVSTSAWHDVEILMYLNSSRETDGRYFCWVDDTLIHSTTTVKWVPTWVRSGLTVQSGASVIEVPSQWTQPRWANMFMDSTYGGGLRIPPANFDLMYRRWYFGGVPATGDD